MILPLDVYALASAAARTSCLEVPIPYRRSAAYVCQRQSAFRSRKALVEIAQDAHLQTEVTQGDDSRIIGRTGGQLAAALHDRFPSWLEFSRGAPNGSANTAAQGFLE